MVIMIRAKLDDLNIGEEAPFENDILEREESIKMLTGVISTVQAPVVLAIDSSWGTGKTTFVKLWKQYLENNKFRCIYYNAWENDFCDDPLVSMMGEIDMGVESFGLEGAKGFNVKSAMAGLKETSSYLGKKLIPYGIKLITSGALDMEKVYEKILSDAASDISKDAIDQYEQSKNLMVDFKSKLEDVIEIITENDNPLVFFIDELDRCRPNFAVELLEKAKHFFSVPRIVFVLSVDMKQLGYAVKSIYGNEVDVSGYLKRFIDIDYKLPVNSAIGFSKHLFDKFGLSFILSNKENSDILSYDVDCLIVIFNELSLKFGFSLRTQEKCLSRVATILHFSDRSKYVVVELLILFVFLREVGNENSYLHDVNEDCNSKIIDFIINHKDGEEFLNTYAGFALEAAILSGHESVRMDDLIYKYTEDLNKPNLDRQILVKLDHTRSCLLKIKKNNSEGSSRELLEKIELVGGLTFSTGLHNYLSW